MDKLQNLIGTFLPTGIQNLLKRLDPRIREDDKQKVDTFVSTNKTDDDKKSLNLPWWITAISSAAITLSGFFDTGASGTSGRIRKAKELTYITIYMDVGNYSAAIKRLKMAAQIFREEGEHMAAFRCDVEILKVALEDTMAFDYERRRNTQSAFQNIQRDLDAAINKGFLHAKEMIEAGKYQEGIQALEKIVETYIQASKLDPKLFPASLLKPFEEEFSIVFSTNNVKAQEKSAFLRNIKSAVINEASANELLSKKSYAPAAEQFGISAKTFRDAGLYYRAGLAYLQQGSTLLHTPKFVEALKPLEMALNIMEDQKRFDETGQTPKYNKNLTNILELKAKALQKIGTSESLTQAIDAISKTLEINPNHIIMSVYKVELVEAKILVESLFQGRLPASAYNLLRDYKTAAVKYRRLAQEKKNNKDHPTAAKYFLKAGEASLRADRFKTAATEFDKALELVTETSLKDKADLYGKIARAYEKSNATTDANDAYFMQAKILISLALKDNTRDINLLKKSLTILSKNPNDITFASERAEVLLLIGRELNGKGEFSNASNYFGEAAKIHKEITGNIGKRVASLHFRACACSKSERLFEGMDAISTAIILADKNNIPLENLLKIQDSILSQIKESGRAAVVVAGNEPATVSGRAVVPVTGKSGISDELAARRGAITHKKALDPKLKGLARRAALSADRATLEEFVAALHRTSREPELRDIHFMKLVSALEIGKGKIYEIVRPYFDGVNEVLIRNVAIVALTNEHGRKEKEEKRERLRRSIRER